MKRNGEADRDRDGESGTGFDWAALLYIGTVPLRLSEREFWRWTPRKLLAVWRVHRRATGTEEERVVGFIDEVM